MVNNKSIKVSLIVPVYNVELYLKKCLNSLINQTLIEIEVIVINDGSTDNSGKIADEYARKDSRVKVVHQENQGLSFARNQGIKLAKGKYIAFVDSDDWIKADAYRQLYEEAEKRNADIVLGDLFYYARGKRLLRARKYFFPTNRIISGKECFVRLIEAGNYGAMVCMNLYQTEFIRKNHLHFKFLYHEDEAFTPMAFYYAERVIDWGKAYYYYRQREGSIMHAVERKVRFRWICRVVDYLFEFVEKNLKNEDADILGAFLFRAVFLYMSAAWLYVLLLKEKKDYLYLPPLKCYKLKLWQEQGRKEYQKSERLYLDLLDRQRRLICFNQSGDQNLLKYA